jgi:NADP-reducing hydrogenase subunit HndA
MAKNKLKKIPFAGTKEQEDMLVKSLSEYKDTPGGLMPVMQAAQEIYGYLPIEVQKVIADGMKVPLEEVFGIATFYSLFTLNPQGKNQVSICMGTACYVKGAGDILEAIEKNLGIKGGECTSDGNFSILETRCIGCCGLAPVITVNANVYGKITVKEVDGILVKYK